MTAGQLYDKKAVLLQRNLRKKRKVSKRKDLDGVTKVVRKTMYHL